ncbi:type III-B CRISPR module-associated protein Cmr3 [Thermococcus sp. 18S1]|uniref:type III-B CRISPR module-associated protein Cmr3 n=1 Tax=Thermococcus sp. 18S1 TaxID=1638210 RepID=UPI0014396BE2|nr:type III-B CRISPR module-associated protein Cmr3 [Thermococcus sp. 18S1]NJE31236.1 type III-B CRISPR module-associated protein Cmr3 [Thermococcus sp. 18S1]
MRVIFDPYDVLFFRDSRNFSAGESHIGTSLPYVPPSTAVGALRHVLYRKNEKCRVLANPGMDCPHFSVKGAFFAKNGVEVFPLPRDIVRVRVNGEEKYTVAKVHEDGVVTAMESVHFSPAHGFLKLDKLKGYLAGNLAQKDVVPFDTVTDTDKIFEFEERIGIGLNNGKTTEEGLLYRTRNLRPKEDVTVSVWVEGGENESNAKVRNCLGENEAVRLGGEGHFAFIEVDDGTPWERFKEIHLNSGRIKLYVATPLIPRNDGYTWGITEVLKSIGIEAVVIKAFTDKPVRVEGWDYHYKAPKKVRYAIPAGSVYILEVRSGVEHLKPVMNLGELSCLGYGLVFMGRASSQDRGD